MQFSARERAWCFSSSSCTAFFRALTTCDGQSTETSFWSLNTWLVNLSRRGAGRRSAWTPDSWVILCSTAVRRYCSFKIHCWTVGWRQTAVCYEHQKYTYDSSVHNIWHGYLFILLLKNAEFHLRFWIILVWVRILKKAVLTLSVLLLEVGLLPF